MELLLGPLHPRSLRRCYSRRRGLGPLYDCAYGGNGQVAVDGAKFGGEGGVFAGPRGSDPATRYRLNLTSSQQHSTIIILIPHAQMY